EGANLGGAIALRAKLHGAKLRGAKLQETALTEGQLQGADLRRVDFFNTRLDAADLYGACVGYPLGEHDFVLHNCLEAIQDLDENLFSDGSLRRLRDNKNWKEEFLDYREFVAEWRAWQNTLPDFPEEWKVQLKT
ncbi:MAG: pentapeptide repeat-containing protein, partial [Pseudomonadota bacterium]